jgi:membrane associated rhomboid family serine protease
MTNLALSEAPVTLFLLIINVLVSGYTLFVDASLLDRLSFKVDRILTHREYHRLFTAGFVHVGLMHLVFNMLVLYFFGPLLEIMVFGSFRFLLLYFGSELFAHGLTLLLHKNNPTYAAAGASGAINGIVFAFCIFFPFEKIYLFFAIGMPAIVFALGYAVLSIYAMRVARAEKKQGGIAHEAHLGGALGGVILTLLLEPRALGIFLGHLGF